MKAGEVGYLRQADMPFEFFYGVWYQANGSDGFASLIS